MGTLVSSLEAVTLEVLKESGLLKMSNTMGSMNLEDYLKSWTPETILLPTTDDGENGDNKAVLEHQGSLGISGNFSEKMSDEVWREIQQGGSIKACGEVKREPSIGTMTLEDYLTKEGAIDECPLMPLDASQCFSQQLGLSPAPLISGFSDTPVSERKRGPLEKLDRRVEKKLKRKIKNRESAARSRARKQAYHNELVGKVSCLEEQNMRLKKEQGIEKRFCNELADEPRFQLRRTSSALF